MDFYKHMLKQEKEIYEVAFDSEIQKIRDRLYSDNWLESFGAIVCGPMFTGFCEYALNIARKEGIRQIFPVMREGILYSRILDKLVQTEDDFQITPIWVSRKTSFMCLAEYGFDYSFFKLLCEQSPKQIGFAFQRLGIEEYAQLYKDDEELINEEIRNGGDVLQKIIYNKIVASGLLQQINDRIKREEESLKKYLESKGGTKAFATLDIGSLGTIPRAIDNCTNPSVKKVHVYLQAHRKVLTLDTQKHDIRYLFLEGTKDADKYDVMTVIFSHMWETITMGDIDKGTVIGYEESSNGIYPVNERKKIDDYTYNCVKKIKSGIDKFVDEYIKLKLQHDIDCHKLLLDGVGTFCRTIFYPTKKEALILGPLSYDCSEQGVENRFLGPIPLPQKACKLDDKFIYIGKGIPIWLDGFKILNTENKEHYEKKKYAVFGLGSDGKQAIRLLEVLGVKVECIIDSFKYGTSYKGLPVIKLDELENYDVSNLLIASTAYEREIEKQVLEYIKEKECAFNIQFVKKR